MRLAGPRVILHLPSEQRTIEATREEFEEEVRTAIPIGSLALIDWVNRGGHPRYGAAVASGPGEGERSFHPLSLEGTAGEGGSGGENLDRADGVSVRAGGAICDDG
ncbi:MAG: hypothetical protein MPW15_11680 [Candidatus Manganitrophus sp.]|nr:hypothetical protein [Candidatus Manganitrophus sp.]